MIRLDELRVSWTALAVGPSADGEHLATLPLRARVGGESMLVGRDLDGRRHLLVPAGNSVIAEDTSSDAVRIVELRLGTENDSSRYTDVVCRDPQLADVFDDLILAMLREIEAGRLEPSEACAVTLQSWREMLRPQPREPLNAKQMAGLVAELHTAVELLRRDPERRIDVWTGPTGARHDFRRGRDALEVKASLSQGEGATEIHGLDQLVAPDGGRLHLIWMRLERVPDGDVSVAGLVERLRRLIGGSPALYMRLTEAGWRPETASAQMTFEIRERRVFSVGEDFPRLVPAMLPGGHPPAGVRNVRYEIALDPIPALTGSEAQRLLDELATGDPAH